MGVAKRNLKIAMWLVGVVAFAMVLEIIILNSFNKKNMNKTSTVLLNQVVSILEENEKNEADLIKTLKEDYIVRAQAVSYIIESKRSIEFDVSELKKIAAMLQIDEIHLFNKKGQIYSGTEPEYYGYNFDSGEQMAYFKPMLTDTFLTMCQDVTPNTAEGKNMMYAITWSEDGDKMVQVGIEPLRLLEELRQNEISKVIADMPAYDGVNILVAYADTGEVCGSTDSSLLGMTLEEIGISQTASKLVINGCVNYCNSKATGEYIVFTTYSTSESVKNFVVALIMELVYLILAGIVIVYMIHYVTKSIEEEKKKEAELVYKSNVDKLTGLLNRRAYEDNIAEYNDTVSEDDFVFVSLDVNGLKTVNDTKGHVAGDELLIGAASCMQQSFGAYGRVYRTGGDEFAAIIFVGMEQLERIKQDFEEITSKWSGRLIDSISVSCGYVIAKEEATTSVHELADIADKRMYEDKARHYGRV